MTHDHGLTESCRCEWVLQRREPALNRVIDAVQAIAQRVSRIRLLKECDEW